MQFSAGHLSLFGTGNRPPVVWEKRKTGEMEITVSGGGQSPILYTQDFHTEMDIAANGRLLQSIKTALRDPKYEGTRFLTATIKSRS